MPPRGISARSRSSKCNCRSGWSRKKNCKSTLAAANALPPDFSSGVHQPIAALPGFTQPTPYLTLFFFWDLAASNRYEPRRLCLGQFQKIPVAHQVGYPEVRDSRLPGTKELSRAAQLQVQLGQFEAVLRAHHGRQPFCCRG